LLLILCAQFVYPLILFKSCVAHGGMATSKTPNHHPRKRRAHSVHSWVVRNVFSASTSELFLLATQHIYAYTSLSLRVKPNRYTWASIVCTYALVKYYICLQHMSVIQCRKPATPPVDFKIKVSISIIYV